MSTNEIIEKIYNRFQNDPAGFCCAFTEIFRERDGSRQAIYNEQLQFMNLLKPTDRVVAVLKCRQSGFSTSIKAKSLHGAYFGKVPAVLICSASQLQATKVLREIKEAILTLPDFLKPEMTKESETELHFKSGSKLISLPMSPNTCRGFQGNIMCDEFGLLSRKDSEALWEAVLPALTKGYNLVAVSTPKGKDNLFYDLCNPKKDEFGNLIGIRADRIIRVPYTVVPHVKKAVEEMELDKKMPYKSFLQEYMCEFVDDQDESLFSFEFINDKLVDKGLEFHNLSIVDGSTGDTVGDSYVPRDLLKQFDYTITGFDPALSGGDGSVAVTFGIKGDEWKMIALKILPKGMSITDQVNYVARMCSYFKCRKLGFDATTGLGIAFEQEFKKTWVSAILAPFKFTNSSKVEEYTQLKSRIETHKMKCPEHPELIKQFTNLGYNPITGRIASMGSWRTNHDDIPSAIITAHAARNKSSNSGFSFL